MSLVSYADSDDSGEEVIDEPYIQKDNEKIKDKVLKSGIKDQPIENKQASNTVDEEKSTKPKSIGSLFSSLPAPWMSSVSWANKSSRLKPGAKQNTVKISVPSIVDDSDSDEEESVRKKLESKSDSQKPSGLFSLLPKPKHSVAVKENNPNRPVAKISNRPLIPDSLRRKHTKKPAPPGKRPALSATKEDSDDDSDGGQGGSFFTWNEKETSTSKDISTSLQEATDMKKSTEDLDHSIGVTKTRNTENIVPLPKSSASSKEDNKSLGQPLESSNTKRAQSFSQAVSNINTNEQSEYLENRNLYTDDAQQYSYQETSKPPDYSVGYLSNYENTGYTHPNYPYYYSSEQYNQVTIEPSNPNWQAPAQPAVQETPEELKRFFGKHGRAETNIDIIDINVDDQVGSSQEWKSHIQKEDADYRPPSKKKDNLPSSQQRRKHQITYLAFQAKEKEWELRNQWSANRQSKRQTQSKYGF